MTDELAQDLRAARIEIGSDTARDDAIAHEPVAEAAIGGAQHTLAQHAAMGVHERESGVIADRTNVAEMIRQPLELRHEGAQPHGAGRWLCRAGGFGGAGKSIGISNRGVARGASCEESAVRQVGARNQAFDALVDIAETLFEPNHGLAIRSEAEMPRLDDAGMNRPDRNLMEAGPLGGQERVGHAVDRVRAPPRRADASPPIGRGRASRARPARPAARGRTGPESARSSLIAGGCRAPIDGKLPSAHARVRIPGAPCSSITAMCTWPASPQSPNSTKSPAASRSMACCQTVPSTSARGNGRWRPSRRR